ncbi:malonate decarboxylase acyl carrier protein [Schauerella aestuarii]|uniref:malonate decarboxylase acyl carrier protein n=1 Tax=Schauerella aestuarii TaxID=2511204 RepID=UPI001370B5CF|nr:malonate decarboxylase acyl carrier protein [Achromobacter aestuarii]MYZ44770.1 malonate decarboxylase acyl carrier protein [Achromobacter aestuarii]
MEHLHYRQANQRPADASASVSAASASNATRNAGDACTPVPVASAIVGVVASGNLEVLVERALPDDLCEVDIRTSATGFADVWQAVIADFADRGALGGLRFSINDGGARPDTVSLRLAQALRAMAGGQV